MKGPYFTGKHGCRVHYVDIARDIAERYPEHRGKHIFIQIEALGLWDEFQGGETPHGLPYSFTSYEPKEETCLDQ